MRRPASHEFDLRGALEQLFAHTQTDLIRAVSDIGAAGTLR